MLPGSKTPEIAGISGVLANYEIRRTISQCPTRQQGIGVAKFPYTSRIELWVGGGAISARLASFGCPRALWPGDCSVSGGQSAEPVGLLLAHRSGWVRLEAVGQCLVYGSSSLQDGCS